jgi:hypothetical protein
MIAFPRQRPAWSRRSGASVMVRPDKSLEGSVNRQCVRAAAAEEPYAPAAPIGRFCMAPQLHR